jgi:hypothetical protein
MKFANEFTAEDFVNMDVSELLEVCFAGMGDEQLNLVLDGFYNRALQLHFENTGVRIAEDDYETDLVEIINCLPPVQKFDSWQQAVNVYRSLPMQSSLIIV